MQGRKAGSLASCVRPGIPWALCRVTLDELPAIPRFNPAGRSLCLEVTSSETGSALVPWGLARGGCASAIPG